MVLERSSFISIGIGGIGGAGFRTEDAVDREVVRCEVCLERDGGGENAARFVPLRLKCGGVGGSTLIVIVSVMFSDCGAKHQHHEQHGLSPLTLLEMRCLAR